tara:strand:- start:18079 stop:18300 length:222 start_codon:yes stop_codon:yes gene_type:complete
MNEKQEAKDLVDSFIEVNRKERYQDDLGVFEAKQCALICANKILDSIPLINNTTEQTIKRVYYINVIQEINKL